MNEYIPSQELMEKVGQAASANEPSEKFLLDLRSQLERRAGERRAGSRRTRRIAWSVSLSAAIVIGLIVAIVGPANVVAALQEALGYIPGFGVVRMTSLRMLAEPVVVTRDGVTLTIKSVIADSTQTAVSYDASGLHPPYVDPYTTPDPNICTSNPSIRFSNNQEIQSTGGGGISSENYYSMSIHFPPLPDDVVDATLVFPCFSGIVPGTAPANWEVPFHLIREATAPTVVPVQLFDTPAMENGATPSQSPTGNRFLQEISLKLDSMAEVEDGFILMGSVQTTSDKYLIDPFFAPDAILIRDSSGAEIPAEMASVGDVDPLPAQQPTPTQWAYKVRGKYFRNPLTITLKYVTVSPTEDITFHVDIGLHPQAGQVWALDQQLNLFGYLADLQSAKYVVQDDVGPQAMQGLEFSVRVPNEIEGLQLNYWDPNPPPGTGGGFTSLSDGMKHGKDTIQNGFLITWPFSGNIGVTANVIHVNGPWSVTWKPPTVAGAASPTPIPQACLANGSWEAIQSGPASPIPSEVAGALLSYQSANPGGILEMFLSGLDGSDKRLLQKKVMDADLSKDGKWLAYVDPDGNLSVMNIETTKTQILTQDPVVMHPFWSPDGDWIAFAATDPNGGSAKIITIHPDGTSRREVGAKSNGRDIAGWYPDSSALLVMASDNDQTAGLNLKKLDLKTDAVTPVLPGEVVQGAALSPDGEWVAFLTQEFGRNAPWISMARPDGSNRRLLIQMDSRWVVLNPVWSPDSRWLSLSVTDTWNWSQSGMNILINPSTCGVIQLTGWEGTIKSWVR